jgi:hypothetical protein
MPSFEGPTNNMQNLHASESFMAAQSLGCVQEE